MYSGYDDGSVNTYCRHDSTSNSDFYTFREWFLGKSATLSMEVPINSLLPLAVCLKMQNAYTCLLSLKY